MKRKMHKGKTMVKGLAAPSAKKTYAITPKRPAKEDVPGHLTGGKQPVPSPRNRAAGKGAMGKHGRKMRGVLI
jgi:hypothetical protein